LIRSSNNAFYIDYLLIFLGWGISHFILFQIYGVNIVNDSPRYLSYAHKLLSQGQWYRTHDIWYFSYVLYVAFIFWVGGCEKFIVGGQVILSGIALYFLYHSAILLTQKRIVGLLAVFFYLLWFKISAWNFYILTESLYASMICITLYFIIQIPTQSSSYYFGVLPLVLFTAMARPTGIALLGAFLLMGFSILHQKYRFSWQKICLASMVLLCGFYFLLNRMLQTFVIVENYAMGEIVFGVTQYHSYRFWLTVSNENLIVPSTQLAPIDRLFWFVIYNPIYFFKLASFKLFWFLGHIKPYYSLKHNLFIMAVLYPLYFFCIKGILYLKKIKPLQHFMISYVTLHCLIIMFNNEDWDGRFIISILPVVFLMASVGMKRWLAIAK
jgi:hypothetical protein